MTDQEQRYLLAFEFGMYVSEVAKDMGKPLTSEISTRACEILLKEFQSERTNQQIKADMIPLVLAAFEPKEGRDTSKKSNTKHVNGRKKG